jgi:hypothetical protein
MIGRAHSVRRPLQLFLCYRGTRQLLKLPLSPMILSKVLNAEEKVARWLGKTSGWTTDNKQK